MSDELSYANPSDTTMRRMFMRGIENLSGRQRLLRLYHRWQRESVDRSPSQWQDALKLIGTELAVTGPADWREVPAATPLVVIANHPFGIADGVAIMALAEQLGRPYRVLVNADLMRIPEMRAKALPIDFNQTREAVANNLKTRNEARRLLKEGVVVVIFPAGGVATAEKPFGQAEDLPWKQFASRLVEQSEATVLPVYFEGQNSALFHFVSRYSLMLRLSLLVCEFRFKIGNRISAHVGAPVAWPEIKQGAAGGVLIDELHYLVHRLAPTAAGATRASIAPRPPEVRRRYPWDAPPRVRPDRSRSDAVFTAAAE